VTEAAEHQRFTQMAFIPVTILTGYWMAILGAGA